jgi:hypothetical protein
MHDREKSIGVSYSELKVESPEDWGYAIYNGKEANLYSEKLLWDFFGKPILEHLIENNIKNPNIFEIGGGDNRLAIFVINILLSKGINPNWYSCEPSMSDSNSAIAKSYSFKAESLRKTVRGNQILNRLNIIPKPFQDVLNTPNSQDIVISNLVLQYTPSSIKEILTTQKEILNYGGIGINYWIGAETDKESESKSRMMLSFDQIRNPKKSNINFETLKKDWRMVTVQEYSNAIQDLKLRNIIQPSSINDIYFPVNCYKITNGSRFTKEEIQSKRNAIFRRFEDFRTIHPEYFEADVTNLGSYNLPLCYSIFQK